VSGQHATLAHKAAEEFKAMLALAAYLFVGLGALSLEKTALLHAEGIDYAAWGGAAVKALVLAKFMLVGHALRLGERYRHKPLIWPTLHMGLMFLVLLLVLTTIEETVVGLIKHRPFLEALTHVAGPIPFVALGNLLLMFLILLPYCAFRSLGAVIGEGKLVRLFFVSRDVAPGTD
jgi:hypothetical protein